MNDKNAIKNALASRGWSQEKLALENGYKNQSNIAVLLKEKGSMGVDNLFKLLSSMGYEISVSEVAKELGTTSAGVKALVDLGLLELTKDGIEIIEHHNYKKV
ncbi:hypothetical protein [Bulleidia sp. zg-1006]|uniref:hypothetical protein n=1 Tax=Bulleidia sp. zg-1006 TaxID=2806552 RepID=UPI00193A65F9|nr:hypothetical protein [Bulleidia sp. zg-1006]QRG87155.1 hypothetical protein JOS54_02275 [Bulleidia sp. zg-1006]